MRRATVLCAIAFLADVALCLVFKNEDPNSEAAQAEEEKAAKEYMDKWKDKRWEDAKRSCNIKKLPATTDAMIFKVCGSDVNKGKCVCNIAKAHSCHVGCRELKPACPSECSDKHCWWGEASNGGIPLSGGNSGVCHKFCSHKTRGMRFCGAGPEYQSGLFVDCNNCNPLNAQMANSREGRKEQWTTCMASCFPTPTCTKMCEAGSPECYAKCVEKYRGVVEPYWDIFKHSLKTVPIITKKKVEAVEEINGTVEEFDKESLSKETNGTVEEVGEELEPELKEVEKVDEEPAEAEDVEGVDEEPIEEVEEVAVEELDEKPVEDAPTEEVTKKDLAKEDNTVEEMGAKPLEDFPAKDATKKDPTKEENAVEEMVEKPIEKEESVEKVPHEEEPWEDPHAGENEWEDDGYYDDSEFEDDGEWEDPWAGENEWDDEGYYEDDGEWEDPWAGENEWDDEGYYDVVEHHLIRLRRLSNNHTKGNHTLLKRARINHTLASRALGNKSMRRKIRRVRRTKGNRSLMRRVRGRHMLLRRVRMNRTFARKVLGNKSLMRRFIRRLRRVRRSKGNRTSTRGVIGSHIARSDMRRVRKPKIHKRAKSNHNVTRNATLRRVRSNQSIGARLRGRLVTRLRGSHTHAADILEKAEALGLT